MLEKYFNREFLLEHKKDVIKIVGCIILVIICLLVYATNHAKADETVSDEINSSVAVTEEVPKEVVVDICGAVKSSKVVVLETGSRVEDAIKAAGGLSDDADLSGINRAAELTDGEKIYIPTYDETAKGITYKADSSSTGKDTSGLININTASADELQTLKGIGPVTAEKIVSYRSQYGSFKNIEDIKEVNGIGDKTYSDIKDSITV